MRYILLFLIIIIMLFPIYWMFITSISSAVYTKYPPDLFPRTVTFKTYQELFTSPYVSTIRWAINSVIIVTIGVILSVIVSCSAGYTFSMFRFKGEKAIFWAFIATIMIAPYCLIIPMFVITRKLGLMGWWAAILPYIFDAAAVYIFKSYADTIPRSFVESARMDGWGEWNIMYRIILPLCKPVIGVIILGKAMFYLQNFIWQMLVLQDKNELTLIVGMTRNIYMKAVLSGFQPQDVNYAAAGCIMLVLPLLLFSFTSKYFVGGIIAGGVKE